MAYMAGEGRIVGKKTKVDSPGAPERAQVVCHTNGCERQNRLVIIHQDTVLPVLCGACGQVLFCDHKQEPVLRREGTLGAPVEVSGTRCGVCGVEDVTSRPLPPVDLKSLPVSVLELLGS